MSNLQHVVRNLLRSLRDRPPCSVGIRRSSRSKVPCGKSMFWTMHFPFRFYKGHQEILSKRKGKVQGKKCAENRPTIIGSASPASFAPPWHSRNKVRLSFQDWAFQLIMVGCNRSCVGQLSPTNFGLGGVAERLNATVLKTVRPERVS